MKFVTVLLDDRHWFTLRKRNIALHFAVAVAVACRTTSTLALTLDSHFVPSQVKWVGLPVILKSNFRITVVWDVKIMSTRLAMTRQSKRLC